MYICVCAYTCVCIYIYTHTYIYIPKPAQYLKLLKGVKDDPVEMSVVL